MTKEIFLSLKGLQMDAGEEAQEMETITPADYYMRNGSHYIVYDELAEGSSDITKNMIKFKDSYLEVTKKGLVNVHMIFEENKKNMTSYRTPYGDILIGIDTGSVSIKEKENKINVEVKYVLEANYQYLADCRIEMSICDRAEGMNLL